MRRRHLAALTFGAALIWMGQWDRMSPRLARADNVRSALLLVERGEAPLGIVHATDAAASRGVKMLGTFPAESHPAVAYPFAITRWAAQSAGSAPLLCPRNGKRGDRNLSPLRLRPSRTIGPGTSMVTSAPVRLLAAGSLSAAAGELIGAFTAQGGDAVEAAFGPAGLLRERIEGGEAADLFASASLEHPRLLARAGRGGPPVIFARNVLCALVRPGLTVTADALLEHMLDPAVRLGTSTPKADPSGDYAWELFGRADSIRPGARQALEAKALKLVGGRDAPPAPPGRHYVGWQMAEGRADIFLSYRTSAAAVLRDCPGAQVVDLPAPLAVGADYALTLLSAHPGAAQLACFILSPEGQAILAEQGFSTVTEARSSRRG